MNIYVGNIPYAATETDLEELFQEYGPVATATIIRDRKSGRSKGFGFVEMENQEDSERAIEALDGQDSMGRPLKVNPARPQDSRDTFHNPYTFVLSRSRDKITSGKFAGDFNPLKHDPPLDHASFKTNLWTGHIPIKLTTVTPLVLLKDDGKKRDTTKHQNYDVYSRIPESSLRGMLRSAYEVITNSRYSCFRNDDRLAYRMNTDQATKLIPTIIKKGHTNWRIKGVFLYRKQPSYYRWSEKN